MRTKILLIALFLVGAIALNANVVVNVQGWQSTQYWGTVTLYTQAGIYSQVALLPGTVNFNVDPPNGTPIEATTVYNGNTYSSGVVRYEAPKTVLTLNLW